VSGRKKAKTLALAGWEQRARRRRGIRKFLAGGISIVALVLCTVPALAIEEKPFIKPVTEEPPPGTPANFSADKVTYDPEAELAVATGKVVITYGPYVLNATKVTYNQNTGVFTANGSVQLREPNGNVMLARQFELRDKFKEGFARHLKALLTNHVTITAEYAVRKAGKITVFEKSSYTACDGCTTRYGEPLWELVADETVHNQNTKTLYHKNPRLKVGGVTVAALPYYEHADPTVKRRTGWLRPGFSRGNAYGIGVTAPYFWALAPDKDLTFRPMLTTEQGLVGDVEWRQAMNAGFYNVRAYGVYELSPDSTAAQEKWRGAVKSKGDFAINEDWSWGWNGTAVSDDTFLDDYDYDDRRIAQNEVYLRGLWDRNYVSAQALNFVALAGDVDEGSLPTALPYAMGEHYFSEPVMGGDLRFNWRTYSILREEASTPFTDVNHGTSQTRASGELSWKSEYIGDLGTVITPFASLRNDIFISNNVPDPAAPGGQHDSETEMRILPSAGVDARMPFIGNHEFGQGIFSPVFQFVAAGDEGDLGKIGNEDAITLNFDSTSLFLADRFTGYDRFESGVRANLGLTYSFLGNNGGIAKASLGESFHIAGENSFVDGSGLEGSSSDLVGAILLQPWNNFGVSYQMRMEEDLSAINRHELLAGLTFDRFAFNAGYLDIAAEPAYGRLTRDHWLEGDARIGMGDGWFVFGGARYDLERENFFSTTAGLEFDCQCMNFKVAYTGTDTEDTGVTDHRVTMSIDFATLGGTSFSSGF
jgi:LPS-assembly protein